VRKGARGPLRNGGLPSRPPPGVAPRRSDGCRPAQQRRKGARNESSGSPGARSRCSGVPGEMGGVDLRKGGRGRAARGGPSGGSDVHSCPYSALAPFTGRPRPSWSPQPRPWARGTRSSACRGLRRAHKPGSRRGRSARPAGPSPGKKDGSEGRVWRKCVRVRGSPAFFHSTAETLIQQGASRRSPPTSWTPPPPAPRGSRGRCGRCARLRPRPCATAARRASSRPWRRGPACRQKRPC